MTTDRPLVPQISQPNFGFEVDIVTRTLLWCPEKVADYNFGTIPTYLGARLFPLPDLNKLKTDNFGFIVFGYIPSASIIDHLIQVFLLSTLLNLRYSLETHSVHHLLHLNVHNLVTGHNVDGECRVVRNRVLTRFRRLILTGLFNELLALFNVCLI